MKRALSIPLVVITIWFASGLTFAGCSQNPKPTLIKFDAASLTAVQTIARIEKEQSALGNLAPADALAVRRALVPVIELGQLATDALIAWEPGQPVPPKMLELSKALANLLTSAAAKIQNETARTAIIIAIATAQQVWELVLVLLADGQAPVIIGGVPCP